MGMMLSSAADRKRAALSPARGDADGGVFPITSLNQGPLIRAALDKTIERLFLIRYTSLVMHIGRAA